MGLPKHDSTVGVLEQHPKTMPAPRTSRPLCECRSTRRRSGRAGGSGPCRETPLAWRRVGRVRQDPEFARVDGLRNVWRRRQLVWPYFFHWRRRRGLRLSPSRRDRRGTFRCPRSAGERTQPGRARISRFRGLARRIRMLTSRVFRTAASSTRLTQSATALPPARRRRPPLDPGDRRAEEPLPNLFHGSHHPIQGELAKFCGHRAQPSRSIARASLRNEGRRERSRFRANSLVRRWRRIRPITSARS